jgi:hypothetical protein
MNFLPDHKMRAATAVKDFSIMFGVNNNLSLIWHRIFTSVPQIDCFHRFPSAASPNLPPSINTQLIQTVVINFPLH